MRSKWTALILLACAVAGCATSTGDPAATTTGLTEEALVAQSSLLLNSLARKDSVGAILSAGFTCEVVGDPMEFAMNRRHFRTNACTGLGIPVEGQTKRGVASKDEVIHRRAEATDLRATITGDTATVTSTQRYYGWMPTDGDGVRVARVTDTWRAESGAWRLLRRVSEPATE